MRLVARLRHFLGLPGPGEPPPGPLAELAARVAELEKRAELEVERDLKWADMNAQLRRYLGRLDAHAGRERQADTNGTARGLHARADVIAAKFPHGLPPKE